MPVPAPEALAFLLARRSRPARTLTAPGPDRAELTRLLTAATRVPDHGKLEPWRFHVLTGAAGPRLAALTRRLGAEAGRDPEAIEKAAAPFETSPVTVAVIAAPQPSEKIPEHEQTLSAGAACLQLLNAALAAGWGACWLSGWMATDRAWLAEGLGLSAPDWVAGFLHLGTETQAPPDRPRPDLARVVTWTGT